MSFAVLFVFPFRGVWLFSTHPLVVCGPADAIIEDRGVFQEFVNLHITCMIGGIVPERTYLSRIVGLPIGIYLIYNILYFLDSPLPGFCRQAGSKYVD